MIDIVSIGAGGGSIAWVEGDAWASRVTREWEGRTVSAVSREALIALKRLRGSPQDLADIAALEQPE